MDPTEASSLAVGARMSAAGMELDAIVKNLDYLDLMHTRQGAVDTFSPKRSDSDQSTQTGCVPEDAVPLDFAD